MSSRPWVNGIHGCFYMAELENVNMIMFDCLFLLGVFKECPFEDSISLILPPCLSLAKIVYKCMHDFASPFVIAIFLSRSCSLHLNYRLQVQVSEWLLLEKQGTCKCTSHVQNLHVLPFSNMCSSLLILLFADPSSHFQVHLSHFALSFSQQTSF